MDGDYGRGRSLQQCRTESPPQERQTEKLGICVSLARSVMQGSCIEGVLLSSCGITCSETVFWCVEGDLVVIDMVEKKGEFLDLD